MKEQTSDEWTAEWRKQPKKVDGSVSDVLVDIIAGLTSMLEVERVCRARGMILSPSRKEN